MLATAPEVLASALGHSLCALHVAGLLKLTAAVPTAVRPYLDTAVPVPVTGTGTAVYTSVQLYMQQVDLPVQLQLY